MHNYLFFADPRLSFITLLSILNDEYNAFTKTNAQRVGIHDNAYASRRNLSRLMKCRCRISNPAYYALTFTPVVSVVAFNFFVANLQIVKCE